MRTTLFLSAAFILAACSPEVPTEPVTNAALLPSYAAQRQTLTTTFTLREQNPCNLEPVTFQVVFTLRQIETGSPSGAPLLRTGIVESFTGVGDFGTVYTGQEHTNVVFHRDPDGLWGTSGRLRFLRGSVPGTSFLIVSRSILDRKTGDVREVVSKSRCL